MKRTIQFTLIIDFFLVIISIVGIYQISERATISGAFLKKDDGVYLRKIIPDTETGIFQRYDRIVSINEKPVNSPTELEFVLDKFRIGNTVQVVVERNDEYFTLSTQLTPFFPPSYIFIVLFVGLFYLLVAILVLVKRPDDNAARVFHWASVMVAMIIMLTWGCYTIQPFGAGHLVRIVNTVAYILTPVLFLHFSLLFPSVQIWGRQLVKLLYVIAIGLISWISAAFILAAEPLALISPQGYIDAYDAGRIFFSSCVIFSVANIQYKYFKIEDEVGRRKLRWVMLGISSVPLVFIGLWQLPQTFLDQAWIQEEIVVLVSALIPITFAISIVKYRLFNIDQIFKRTTVYTIVIAIVLGLYIFIVGLTADFLGNQFAMSTIFVPAFAAIIVALVFEPLRRSVQTFVDKTYFRIQYDYREAMNSFEEEIKDIHDPNDTAIFIVRKIESLLPVRCTCVITTDKDGRTIHNLVNNHFAGNPSDLSISFETESGLHIYALEDVIESGREFKKVDPRDMPPGISVIVSFPLENADSRWFLLLGPKKSDAWFSIEDVDLIKSFVNQGAMLIDRLLLQRNLIIEREHAHQLEELNRLKSFFVSSVSHDLKTPLTSIRMFAEMLQEKKKHISRSEKEYLEIIQGESERLARLIDNVLEFTKIERGMKKYQLTEIELNALVETVLKIFQYQFVLQNVTLKTSLHRKEIRIIGDHDALVQVLTNLLANAIKYSPGKKYIGISTGVSSNRAYIRITDKGIGINQKDVKNIFKPFFRSSHPEARHLDGAGLGLALVRHIMEAHNGTVEVKSTGGKGSTFTVHIPVRDKKTRHSQKYSEEIDTSMTIM